MEADIFHDIEEGEILDGDLESPKNSDSESERGKSCNINNQNDFHYQFCNPMDSSSVKHRTREKLYTNRSNHVGLPFRKIDHNFEFFSFGGHPLDTGQGRLYIDKNNSYSPFYHGRNLSEKREMNMDIPKGTAEDIMCQIDRVVCRKKHNDRRIRKSRDFRRKLDMPYEIKKLSYGLRSEKSNVNNKERKRQNWCRICSQDSRQVQNYDEKFTNRKRFKIKKVKMKIIDENNDDKDNDDDGNDYENDDDDNDDDDDGDDGDYVVDNDDVRDGSHGDSFYQDHHCNKHHSAKSNKNDSRRKDTGKYIRDFDEMRKNLLERLKKKEQEKIERNNLKDMDVDCEADEEMDLAQLRLMALTSNKNKKSRSLEKEGSRIEKFDNGAMISNPIEPTSYDAGCNKTNLDESEFDRNELLLRAEALKTALLKKHQKRLNKLNGKNQVDSQMGSTCKDDLVALSDEPEDEFKRRGFEEDLGNFQESKAMPLTDDFQMENQAISREIPKENIEVVKVTENEAVDSETGSSPQKRFSKTGSNNGKIKKGKKRQSQDLSHVKENEGEVDQTMEEDCQSLRNQLLCDLVSKKCSKSPDKKSVLLDSMQRSANSAAVKGNNELFVDNNKSYVNISRSVNKVRPGNVAPKSTMIPQSDIQRVIVHLGSEDSSEDDLVGNGSHKDATRNASLSQERGKKETGLKRDANVPDDNCQKVMLLLGQTRKLVDEEQQRARAEKLSATEAICKHLPLSQRIEYFRLKQKIAEREKERKKIKKHGGKSIESCCEGAAKDSIAIVQAKTSTSTDSKNLSTKTNEGLRSMEKMSGERSSVEKVGGAQDLDSCPRGPRPTGLDEARKMAASDSARTSVRSTTLPRPLPPSDQTLMSKLKFLLKKVKIEKAIEENYGKEIAKLKSQLMLFEKRKNEQRFKIKKLVEESVKTYNQMTKSDKAKTDTESTIEIRPEKEAEPGKKESRQGEDDGSTLSCISKAEKERPKKTEEIERAGDKMQPSATTASSDQMIRYDSPLQAFSRGSDATSERLDPNVIMCQFDITGVCRDEECTYQHYRVT